jgi:hypothetical protein
MNLKEAKSLYAGRHIFAKGRYNANGTAMGAKVTSVKTWKTRPNEVEIHYKRGMYEYGTVNEREIANFTTKEPAARKPKKPAKKVLRTPRPYYPQYGIR